MVPRPLENAVLARVECGAHSKYEGRPPLLYQLITTHNATGRKIANDILSAGEYV
jgi:hypothetical protein